MLISSVDCKSSKRKSWGCFLPVLDSFMNNANVAPEGLPGWPFSASWTAWSHFLGPGTPSPREPWLWRQLFHPTAHPCHRVPTISYCFLYSKFSSPGLWTIVCGIFLGGGEVVVCEIGETVELHSILSSVLGAL